MNVAIVVAMDLRRGIGLRGKLPWGRIAHDLRRFRELTMGYPVIMGRATFESLPAPLSGRTHIVLTRQTQYWAAPRCHIAHSFGDALSIACSVNVHDRRFDKRESLAFVVGGAEVYGHALCSSYVDYMYITRVGAIYEADTFFPSYAESAWVAARPAEIAGWEGIQLSFEVYRRLRQ